MGFYGNITNTSRTQFVFDRTYSSRYAMDKACETDGVYVGRYVLVEYETDISEDTFLQGYYCVDGDIYTQITTDDDGFSGAQEINLVTIFDSNGQVVIKNGDVAKIDSDKIYSAVNTESRYIAIVDSAGNYIDVTYEQYLAFWSNNPPAGVYAHLENGKIVNFSTKRFKVGDYILVPAGYAYNTSENTKYFLANVDNNQNLTWTEIDTSQTGTSNYFANFSIDRGTYGTSRGYDSTVWQKVYTAAADATTGSQNEGRYEKYVMIAELNTVVPTFDISADAPTLIPIAPHFDTNSTNVYYKFHWQPQWGVRTKAARKTLVGPSISANGEFSKTADTNLTSDEIIYPSDQTTSWFGKFYNSSTDELSEGYYSTVSKTWTNGKEDVGTSFPAAIYYNKAGFDPANINYSADLLDTTQKNFAASIAASGWNDEDKIQLQPTGISGHTYSQHGNRIDSTIQEDTQELSIMLPSLGNAIANMWDIIYGGRETNDYIADTNERNLDIAWEDAAKAPQRQGLRLVTTKESGNGYELTDIESNTVAGIINSVHDLMGMIIVDNADNFLTSQEAIDEADSSAIYYYNDEGKFKRKHLTYDYEELEYSYEPVTFIDEDKYFKGYYYLDAEGAEVASGEYDSTVQYYEKVVSTNDLKTLYEEIDLLQWTPNLYYYKTLNGEWRKENSEVASDGAQYYLFKNATIATLDGSYEPGALFYKDTSSGSAVYILSEDELPSSSRSYFEIPQSSINIINLNMIDDKLYNNTTGLYNGEKLVYLYQPATFYYIEIGTDGNSTGTYIREDRSIEDLEAAGYWDEDGYLKVPLIIDGENILDTEGNQVYYKYVMIKASEAENATGTITVRDPITGKITTKEGIDNAVNIEGIYSIEILKFEENKYYYYNSIENKTVYDENGIASTIYTKYIALTSSVLANNYTLLFSDSVSINPLYFTLDIIAQGTFYSANDFWYKTSDDNYVIDPKETQTEGRVYYSAVNFTPVQSNFYIDNKYYYKKSNGSIESYVLSTDGYNEDRKPYYLKNNIYVIEDTTGIYPPGTTWTSSMTTIPSSIKIGKRTPRYEMIELEGLARDLNTIHGLILRINELVEFNDTETRNSTTLQGCINLANDYLNRFNTIPAQEILVTDSYGRIDGASWTTAQEFIVDNWQESIEDTVEEELEARWLNLELNSDPDNPYLILKHRFNLVEDTATISDKNGDITNGTGNNNTTDDTLKLLTPIVDNMGHVVGKNEETITLPYSFKYFTATNNNIIQDSINTINNNNTIADNTKDTFNFVSYNKWLELDTSIEDTLTIGHKYSGVNAGNYGLANSLTIDTLNEDNTFEVPYFTVDEAGHITSAETNTVVIPENFSYISIGVDSIEVADSTSASGMIEADSLVDTFIINPGNKWIQLKADTDNDTLEIRHYVKQFSETTAITDNNNQGTFTVQEINWDEAGHLTASVKRTYTLPYNFKTLSISNSGLAVTTAIAAAGGDLVADSQVDIATFDAGNRWITLTADPDNDKVTIGHAAAGTASTTVGDSSAQTPNFGATFKVPYIGIDQAGHVSTLTDHDVTIPLPSLADTENGSANVMTSLTLTPAAGALVTTHKNVGDLLLTGYNLPTAVSDTSILATESINTAFGKVQFNINSLNNRIDNLNLEDNAQDGEYVSSVSESAGVISVTRVALNPSITVTDATDSKGQEFLLTINTKSSNAISLTSASTSLYGVTKLSNDVNNESEELAATSKAVKTAYDLANSKQDPATTLEGYGITDAIIANEAIEAGTGIKITYDEKGLITSSSELTNEDISTLEFNYGEEVEEDPENNPGEMIQPTLTIEELFAKVAELEARITELQNS